MNRWWLYLIAVLIGVAVVDYFVVRSNFPINLHGMLNIDTDMNNKQQRALPAVPQDARLDALRHRHHLRPLTEREDGKRIEELPDGIYGFSPCSESLDAKRSSSPALEVQKRHDRIVYYVGYASTDDIGKYLARQKNFHIRMLSHPSEHASSLLEIPVYFVSNCELRSSKGGDLFDLFVRDIPELQS